MRRIPALLRRARDSGVIDPEDQPLREAAASKLFSGPVDFLLSAPQLQFLPEPLVPEIAFCGRSNVGKSSLLNALTGRRAIARASVTPGRTQELNFFDVGRPEDEDPLPLFRLVDMPGYGFAKAPVKVVEKWKSLVKSYLRGRQVLSRTLVLVDSRHGLKQVDRDMMTMLDEAAVSYRIVLTKTDKIKASELAAVAEKTAAEAKKHVAAYPDIHLTSAEKGMGIAALRAAVVADALGEGWAG
jgi:GTP-binding protein